MSDTASKFRSEEFVTTGDFFGILIFLVVAFSIVYVVLLIAKKKGLGLSKVTPECQIECLSSRYAAKGLLIQVYSVNNNQYVVFNSKSGLVVKDLNTSVVLTKDEKESI